MKSKRKTSVSENFAASAYYRIEKDRKPIGYTFHRSGPAPLEKGFPLLEALLEQRRPEDKLSRKKAVNMRNDRDFSMMGIDTFDLGFVHQVEPNGSVTEHDVAWIGALQRRQLNGTVTLKDKYPNLSDNELVDKYWSGVRSSSPSMEFHTLEAVVVSVDTDPSPLRPSRMEDALKKVRAFGKSK